MITFKRTMATLGMAAAFATGFVVTEAQACKSHGLVKAKIKPNTFDSPGLKRCKPSVMHPGFKRLRKPMTRRGYKLSKMRAAHRLMWKGKKLQLRGKKLLKRGFALKSKRRQKAAGHAMMRRGWASIYAGNKLIQKAKKMFEALKK